jgi:hypothetical protein
MLSCIISVLVTTKEIKMNKAKIGDRIKSMNVAGMPDRGYYAGNVTKVEFDANYQVYYVYYTATWKSPNGKDLEQIADREMRVLQNGTETLFEGLTNNIEIL